MRTNKTFRLMVICILSFIVSGIVPIVAQEATWEAWLYNPDNGRMLRVGSDSTILADLTLPGLQGNNYPYSVAVSHEGHKIAYVLTNSFNFISTLYLYDTDTNSLIGSYVIPSQQGQMVYDSIQMNTTSQAFSPDDSSFAFGYTIDGAWSLLVIDLVNVPGQILLSLNSSDPLMANVEKFGFDVPTIMRFDGNLIDFIIVPAATEGMLNYSQYTYNIASNSLTRNYYYTVAGGDFYDLDDRYLFSLADYRLPNNKDSYQGMGQQINALHSHPLGTDYSVPIFNAPDRTLGLPRYIQNAERIIVLASTLTDFQSEWWVIDRQAGQQIATLVIGGLYPNGIEGVGDGFVMSARTEDLTNIYPDFASLPNRRALLFANTRVSANGSSMAKIWIGDEGQNFVLSWVKDNLADTHPITAEWTAIGDPIFADNFFLLEGLGTLPPTPIPQGSVGLRVGDSAIVFTTEGDRANVRSAAGTEFGIITRLDSGAIVSIIEGPQSVQGLIWWRVRTSDNQVGWMVESAEGVVVLQPNASSQAVQATPVIAPVTGIAIGSQIVVTGAGNNLNARTQAGTSFPIVATLAQGSLLNVVGGPINADGFTWWQVITTQGNGWIAQGSATENWIIPATG